jgi:hypothetical protein
MNADVALMKFPWKSHFILSTALFFRNESLSPEYILKVYGIKALERGKWTYFELSRCVSIGSVLYRSFF